MWKIHDNGSHPCYNMKNVKSNYETLLLLRDIWKRFPTKGKYNDYEDVRDLKQGIQRVGLNLMNLPEMRFLKSLKNHIFLVSL